MSGRSVLEAFGMCAACGRPVAFVSDEYGDHDIHVVVPTTPDCHHALLGDLRAWRRFVAALSTEVNRRPRGAGR